MWRLVDACGSGDQLRFDPIGPGGGVPDPDHLPVPGSTGIHKYPWHPLCRTLRTDLRSQKTSEFGTPASLASKNQGLDGEAQVCRRFMTCQGSQEEATLVGVHETAGLIIVFR